MSGSRQTRPLFSPVHQLNHVCRVDTEEDVQDFRPLRPDLDPPEIVVLFLCPERAFHRIRHHSGKFLSDKVFLLFSHRTDGLFLRKMSVFSSPCSSPCFQFPRSQCLLQYLAEQVKQLACNLPRLTPSVLALFPVCQVRLLHVKELCPGTVDSQSAAQLKGSGCCCSAVPAVSDSSVSCTSSGTSGQLNLIVFQNIQRFPAKFFSRF